MKREDKRVEKADHAGLCYTCGNRILYGDEIVKDEIGETPIARHAVCDPDFSVGGSSAAR